MVKFLFKCIWYSINRKSTDTSVLGNVYIAFSGILFLLTSAVFILLNLLFKVQFPIDAKYFDPPNRIWMLMVTILIGVSFYFMTRVLIGISFDPVKMEKELIKNPTPKLFYRRIGFLIILVLTIGTYILSSFMSNGSK